MPERLTINYPGALLFVTFSTYQRRRFLAPERTRSIVMESLQSSLEKHLAASHGFVVMPDHVHALPTVEEDSTIGAFLQAWKKTSSYRINRFYVQELTNYRETCPDHCPVGQANYYDFIVESDKNLPEKIDYMHNNAVAARLVESSVEWKWSSARFYELGEHAGVKITWIR